MVMEIRIDRLNASPIRDNNRLLSQHNSALIVVETEKEGRNMKDKGCDLRYSACSGCKR